MDMFEEAKALDVAMKMSGVTQEALAEKFSVSQSYVANKIRLLKFSPEAQNLLRASGLSERHARAVLRLSTDEKQREAINRAALEKLTVSETEQLVDVLLLEEQAGQRDAVMALAFSKLSSSLADAVRILSRVGIRATKSVEENAESFRFSLCVPKAG